MLAVGGTATVLALPLLWLAWRIALEAQAPTSGLGADPGEAAVHFLGEWSLRILLLAFSVTPLFRLTRWSWLAQRRRMVGLFAFAYVVLHLLSYAYYFTEFSWQLLVEDFTDRVYITAGLLALACLLPMAVTSTRGWQRRLGRSWRRLHRLIYPALALALLHLWWQTRDGYGEVLLYVLWFVLLLAARYFKWRRAAA